MGDLAGGLEQCNYLGFFYFAFANWQSTCKTLYCKKKPKKTWTVDIIICNIYAPGQPGAVGAPGPQGHPGGGATWREFFPTSWLLYSGTTGGTLYTHQRGGANHLCMPRGPEFPPVYSTTLTYRDGCRDIHMCMGQSMSFLCKAHKTLCCVLCVH